MYIIYISVQILKHQDYMHKHRWMYTFHICCDNLVAFFPNPKLMITEIN